MEVDELGQEQDDLFEPTGPPPTDGSGNNQ